MQRKEIRHVLDSIFYPESVAVIGASRDPVKTGYIIVQNLINGGFKGSIYPINPKATEILGLNVYSSIKDIPNGIDLAVIVIPASRVLLAIEDCIKKRVKGAIIISAGFREAGPIGAKVEREIAEMTRRRGLRIIGPNSAGIINASSSMYATIEGRPPKGSTAFISQSGAFGGGIFKWAEDLCLGFSKFVSIGNMCDLNFSDFLEYLAQDPETKVIAMYIENINDGRRFISTAKKVSAIKPLIAYKVGRTEAGVRAVASHTGSMAGSDNIYNVAFKQAKVIRVNDAEELLDYAFVLIHQPLPKGRRVGILTDAGGPGVAAADACSLFKLIVPQLPKSTQTMLKQFLPAFASTTNPVDMTFTLDPAIYQACTDLLVNEETVDGIIITITSHLEVQEQLAHTIIKSFTRSEKPILVSWTSGKKVDRAKEILRKNGIPVYPTPEKAARAMACLVMYLDLLHQRKRKY